MEQITHQELVSNLCKPGEEIVQSLTARDAHALHMAVGISGESGELLDAIKKCSIYCKVIDLENVIEELGDLEFYMEGLRQGLGITREETIEANIAKLRKRYSSGKYSNQQAQERADKAEEVEFEQITKNPYDDSAGDCKRAAWGYGYADMRRGLSSDDLNDDLNARGKAIVRAAPKAYQEGGIAALKDVREIAERRSFIGMSKE